MTDFDETRIAELLEQNMPMLQAFIRLRMGPALSARESSADVLQSVCRELIEERGRFDFRGDAALRAWLYTAALRKIMQKARHHRSDRRNVGREAGAADPDAALLQCYASCVTPSRDASAREQVERFERAFQELSPDDQEVISLTKIAGLSHAAAGEQMGRTAEASRTQLRRALVRLAALLEPE